MVKLRELRTCGFTLFLRSFVHEWLGGDLKPNLPMLGHPLPIYLCPCVGIISNSLINIKQLTGQRRDEGGGGSRGFGTLFMLVLPSSCFIFELWLGGSFLAFFFYSWLTTEMLCAAPPSISISCVWRLRHSTTFAKFQGWYTICWDNWGTKTTN
jgi:hypothetical protein